MGPVVSILRPTLGPFGRFIVECVSGGLSVFVCLHFLSNMYFCPWLMYDVVVVVRQSQRRSPQGAVQRLSVLPNGQATESASIKRTSITKYCHMGLD